MHGSLGTSLRSRWTGDESDHDLYEVVTLDLGDPARHRWTGHLLARGAADLDGKESEPSVFSDLSDTFDSSVTLRVYDAWAETREVGPFERLRLGRQTIWETPELAWFDGASAETAESGSRRWKAGLYGGIPVHAFESSNDGDGLLGLWAQARPWESGRVRLDWMHLEDETVLSDHENDLWRLGAWQGLGERLRLDGHYTRLEEHDRDLGLRATWWDREEDLVVRAHYFELLRTQKSLAAEFDPFFASLLEQKPYRQARLSASKGMGEHVDLTLGTDLRRLSDAEDEGTFNHEFDRWYAIVSHDDLLPYGIGLGITGEIWDSDTSDIRTWGADLHREIRDGLDASLGSYYSLYKVDTFTVEERDHVRTWFLRLRWKRTASTTWDLRYELEDTDIDTFHNLRLGMTWRF